MSRPETRGERELDLLSMLKTQAGCEFIHHLYERLFLNSDGIIPHGFVVNENLVALILSKEYPDSDRSDEETVHGW